MIPAAAAQNCGESPSRHPAFQRFAADDFFDIAINFMENGLH